MKKIKFIDTLKLLPLLAMQKIAFAEEESPIWGSLWKKITNGEFGKNATLEADLTELITNIANFILGLASLITALMIIISAIRYITATGNPETTAKATKNLVASITGFIIAILSYAIVETTTIFQNKTSIDIAITETINKILGFGIVLTSLFLIISGYLFITSTGNPDKLSRAKKTLTGSIIGLVVMILAWAITTFISSVFIK